MKKNEKNIGMLSITVAFFLLVASVTLGLTLLKQNNDTVSVFNERKENCGYFTPKVVDGRSNEAISNAKIIILETNKSYYTNENGTAGEIEVPLIRDERYDSIIPKPWGGSFHDCV